MLSTLMSLVLAANPADAGCSSGRCAPVDGVETPDVDSVSSSLALRPGAHLRTATFALG